MHTKELGCDWFLQLYTFVNCRLKYDLVYTSFSLFP